MAVRRRLLWAAAMPALCALASAVQAQYPTPEGMGLNYTLTAGAAFLVGPNINKGTVPTVGVSWYDTVTTDVVANAAVGLSGDWLQITRNNGKTVQMVPVMLNYKQYAISGGYRIFVNLGAGVLALTDTVPEMQLNSKVNFGWTGGFGVDVSNSLFVQARFIGGTNPGNSGLGALELGYRF